jgi:uncharacterized membrane protein
MDDSRPIQSGADLVSIRIKRMLWMTPGSTSDASADSRGTFLALLQIAARMKTRIHHFWDNLTSSLWFIPSLMAAASAGLSFGAIWLDAVVKERLVEQAGWIWGGGPDGAREILSTIAGSMLTVAGVVFSITVVVLALASSQFGPRLLRNFMRDTGNQVVLGTFISTFTYCLLVLRTIRSDGGTEFVPHISVTIGILLALASLGVLIYFIHHVSVSIQAPIVIDKVAQELDRAIERLFPQKLGQAAEPDAANNSRHRILPDFEHEARPVPSCATGYLQAIDSSGLMELAATRDLIVRLHHRPGSFVVEKSDLARVWPEPSVDEALIGDINKLFIFGPERTEAQDVEFSVHQLVEIAVRALSPGINDPFTAITSVHRLGAALCRLARREIPSPYRYDSEKNLRVIAEPVTFADIADAALSPIRQYGRSSAVVSLSLLETLTLVARQVRREEDRLALLQHAVLIAHASREALTEDKDRKDIEERYRIVLNALGDRDTGDRDTRVARSESTR